MILNSLTFIKDVLNQYYKREFSISEDIVLLSNFVNPDGTIPQSNKNKIVFFLVNLNHEPTLGHTINQISNQDGASYLDNKVSLYLNLQILFCLDSSHKCKIYQKNYNLAINMQLELTNMTKYQYKPSLAL